MSFTQYNSTSRSSKNLFRQRSISSLPSRQMSVMNIINERQSMIFTEKKKFEQQKSVVLIKDNEISKLRKNLETAVSTALHQKLQNSKNKDEINQYTHLKKYLESKVKQFEKDLKIERQNCQIFKIKNQQLMSDIEQSHKKGKILQVQLHQKIKIIESMKDFPHQIEQLKIQLKDIEPLKQRIITLEGQVRQQKIVRKAADIKVKQYENQVESLQKLLATTKPREQQLKQRIAYFERVNLDLQRKMEDYNRRENDYIKQVTSLKMILTKVTSQRNHYKTVYQQTSEKLQNKLVQYKNLTDEYNEKKSIILILQQSLQTERKVTFDLKQQIQGKNQFYKKQGEENAQLLKKNKLLQSQQLQLRKVIDGYIRIADQVNLTIVSNIEEIKKLKIMIQNQKIQLKKTQQKFDQFDKIMEQGSEKGFNQINDGFYTLIRANNQLTNLVKQQRVAFDQKVLVFGQERDSILRNIQIKKMELPTDETQYLSIFLQKTESMLLMEKSNDQLLQIKKQLQNRIEELLGQIQKEKRQKDVLKLKAADLFRAKKQLQDSKKTLQRYQQMIQQSKVVIDEIKSQVSALREKNNSLNEKMFVVEVQKRNLQVNVKQMKEIMKQLNVQTLMVHKQINQKNTHLIIDSLQKLQNAIKSLTFYFHCAFCGELPATPITLALCGHNYCIKCKDAYAQSCYQCDTGQPIEKVFQNKFLKDAGGKYKFLSMVVSQLKANFSKKQQ